MALFVNIVAFFQKLGVAKGGDSSGKSNRRRLRRAVFPKEAEALPGGKENTAKPIEVKVKQMLHLYPWVKASVCSVIKLNNIVENNNLIEKSLYFLLSK